MKTILGILATATLAFLVQQVVAVWWVVVIVAGMVAFGLKLSRVSAFISGFLGIALLWAGMAYWLSSANDFILSERMAALFSLNNTLLLVLVTALVGALASGMGALCGSQIRVAFFEQKNDRSKYY